MSEAEGYMEECNGKCGKSGGADMVHASIKVVSACIPE